MKSLPLVGLTLAPLAAAAQTLTKASRTLATMNSGVYVLRLSQGIQHAQLKLVRE